jgi:hypothetical protein
MWPETSRKGMVSMPPRIFAVGRIHTDSRRPLRILLWLRMLLGQLGLTQKEPTLILEDNEGCISVIKNDKDSAKLNHIDITNPI